MLVWLDGKWLNADKAHVSVDNRSFRYGDGIFETIKVVNGQVPLWQHHVQRIAESLPVLRFTLNPFLNHDFLLKQVLTLVSKNQHNGLARVRITIFRGNGGIYDTVSNSPHVLIQSWALPETSNLLNENGLVTGLYHTGRKVADGLSNLKSNSFLLYALAAMHAKENHWNDALVMNEFYALADATIANVWIIKDKHIYTPALSDGPVAGTMRAFLLHSLKDAGWQVTEKSITPGEASLADEMFFTNAIYGLRWVKQFEETTYGSEQSAALYNRFIAPLWNKTI